ncbi:hypothetical protein POPTR_016G082700v4 [Populus trichocarpa]|uniref:Uncharacterized protein n=1 Tax=Populus trichocarpa TaxID=3694 RepID=A0A3N7G579_POPTR|nr:hypothetical protein POPTR_016G082700v4 [Populus trichocarpa]RQP01486.1 hypothetical protein POPTR_016G082700v4 [Populus trichocarpa]|eukprot:XP_024443340.1 uncharacterized protein LOC7465285 isoform X2 [Populus trichocarpa]
MANVRESKKMEGEDSLRTLECLRGRLLAERQASKIAKEEAELMGNKLIELEDKLREEIKLRKKAEKKHKFLMKKLESLKIWPASEGSEKSSSSEISGFCSASSTSTAGHKDPEESESKPQVIITADSQDMKDNGSETTTSNQNICPVSDSIGETQDSNADNNLKDCSLDKSRHETVACSQDSKIDDQSSASIKASVVEMEKNAGNESDNEAYVNNSLALVPLSLPASTKKSELKVVNRSVIEVLDALRHAREQIQSSMERRHMIRVCPT